MSESTTDERFGAAVRARREAMGLTQAEVSEALRAAGQPVSVTALAKVEAGSRAVKIAEAAALARILSLHLDLLTLSEESSGALEGLLSRASGQAAAARARAAAAAAEAARAGQREAALRVLAQAATGSAAWRGSKEALLSAALGTTDEEARAGLGALGLSPEVIAAMEREHQHGGRTDWGSLYRSLRITRLLPGLSLAKEG